MTDENKSTSDQAEPQRKPSGNTTHDLRKHAEEALRMLREQQNHDTKLSPPDETSKDKEDPASSRPGNTTYDLAREAMEAMRKLQLDQIKKKASETDEMPSVAGENLFDGTMLLRVDVIDATMPIILSIQDEMLIGRGDNVTDYKPEIDLTPYGAYRLGLSRRHAKLKRVDNALHLVDLGSRNGTILNGERLKPENSRPVASGDEIQLGNLTFRVNFQKKAKD